MCESTDARLCNLASQCGRTKRYTQWRFEVTQPKQRKKRRGLPGRWMVHGLLFVTVVANFFIDCFPLDCFGEILFYQNKRRFVFKRIKSLRNFRRLGSRAHFVGGLALRCAYSFRANLMFYITLMVTADCFYAPSRTPKTQRRQMVQLSGATAAAEITTDMQQMHRNLAAWNDEPINYAGSHTHFTPSWWPKLLFSGYRKSAPRMQMKHEACKNTTSIHAFE